MTEIRIYNRKMFSLHQGISFTLLASNNRLCPFPVHFLSDLLSDWTVEELMNTGTSMGAHQCKSTKRSFKKMFIYEKCRTLNLTTTYSRQL